MLYSEGVLLQSRLYPDNDNENLKSEYGEIVKNIIATCSDLNCVWEEKEVDDYCATHEAAKHYADYAYEDYNASVYLLSEAAAIYRDITIGEEDYCIRCGNTHSSAGSLVCSECFNKPMYYCSVCGDDISEDEIDNAGNSSHICRHCSEHQNAPGEANNAT